METIHNRMPVILHKDDVSEWLYPDYSDEETVTQFLLPLEDGALTMHPVSKAVNSVKNNDPALPLRFD